MTRFPLRRAIAARLAALWAVACVGAAAAADIQWTNATGGSFQDPANWSAGVPTSADVAAFDLGAAYDVSFAADAVVDRAVLHQGQVNWILGANSISSAGDKDLTVASELGDDARLTIVGGSTNTFRMNVAKTAGTGELVLTDGATLNAGLVFDIGRNGLANARVEAASHVSTFQFFIGGPAENGEFGTGHVVIEGSGSRIEAGNMFLFRGSMTVESGGVFRAQSISGGGGPDNPLLTISGAGSICKGDQLLAFGSDGQMSTVVEQEALLDTARVTVQGGPTGASTLDIVDATWTASQAVEVRGGAIVTISGSSQVALNDVLDISVGGTVNLNGGTLQVWAFENEGTFNWNGGTFEITGSSGFEIGSGGGGGPTTWEVESGQTLAVTNDVQVTDGGQLQVATGGAVQAGGKLQVAAGGKLELTGGAATATEIALEGGLLHGVGQTTGLLTNDGRIEPGFSPGVLTHDGDYEQLADGELAIELASLLEYDALAITGDATLGGALDVSLLGGYEPKLGDSFEILTAASVSGSFASLDLPELSSDLRWSLLYATDGVTLAVTAVPEPAAMAYALGGLAVAALIARRRLSGLRQASFVVAMAAIAACFSSARAADTQWTSTAGGSFQDAANWSAGVPTDANIARFEVNADYTVDFAADASMLGAHFRQGNVTWDLNGNSVQMVGDIPSRPIRIATAPGDDATLHLVGGGTLTSQRFELSYNQGGTGHAILDDGITLNAIFGVWVGYAGPARMEVRDGSSVTTFGAVVGNYSSPGTGELIIDGSGASLTAANLVVAQGRLDVINGGLVHTMSHTFFDSAAAVSGADSQFVADTGIYIGSDNPGALEVLEGAHLNSGNASVGASGQLRIANATWTNSGDAEIHRGEVTIAGSSLVQVGQLLSISPQGTLNLNGGTLQVWAFENEGTFNWNGGTFEITGSSGFEIGSGGGGGPTTWEVENGQTLAVTNDVQVTSGGQLQVAAGGAVQAGGKLQVAAGGALELTGGAATATEIALQGGRLQGVGQTTGLLTNDGRIEPGFSPGVLTHEGDYEQLVDGELAIELASLLEYDALAITGDATLGGALDVSLLGGYEPKLGDSFEILTAASVSGSFASLDLPDLSSDLQWSLHYATDGVTLAVTAVPEPLSLAYAIGAIAALAAVRRRGAAR